MENFIVSARKYRPTTFFSVVGQSGITDTLKNAIRNKHIAQSYLFCGPRGVGKTTCARIFAKTLNCQHLTNETEACDECESCLSFNQSRSFNIHELDAASNNSVEDIRHLIDRVRIPPQVGKYSIYIIDEVHMLSSNAFNAFLKTLEEPPSYAIFILATTEKNKIIPTILSRCQIFDFKRIRVNDLVKYMQYVAKQESIEADEAALNIIAIKADGAMRDALFIFDQIVSFTGNKITYENTIENLNVLDYEYYFVFVNHFLKENMPEVLVTFNEIIEKGFDSHSFINGLAEHLRNLLVCKNEQTLSLLEVGQRIQEQYAQQARMCTYGFLFKALKIINQCDISYRTSKNKRLLVELMLLKLTKIVEPFGKIIKKTEIKKQEKTIPAEKKKIFSKKIPRTNNPVVKTQPVVTASSISIKRPQKKQPAEKIIEKNREEKGVEVEKTESFTPQDVLAKMQQYVKKNDINQRTAATLLIHEPIVKEPFKICIKIDNSLQIKEINRIKPKLLQFLKAELKNKLLTLETLENKDKKGNIKRPYTDDEKFDYMSKKNPALKKLRQQFSLDFE